MKYSDWQQPFESYFGDSMRELCVVELGKGEGTRWLHSRFRQVVSLEYSRYPFTASWENEGLPGHILLNLETPSNISELDNILIRSRGADRPMALREEARKIHEAALGYTGDVLFIDHGCHNRGEVLELALLSQWSYTVIHDANFPYYGYQITSPHHEVKRYSKGQGTIFFKRK